MTMQSEGRATLLPGRALPPAALYLGTALINGVLFTLALTTYGLYVVDAAHLTPLQLVLAGTGLEAAAFISEVPTGVVADVYSRRLSIVIGHVITAAGFALMGAVPSFAFVLLGQVVWGVGYTFGSGAREAWLADEIGEGPAARVYLRAAQVSRVGRLAGIPLGTGLALIGLQAPFLVGGALFLVYALGVAVTMGERGYTPPGRRPGEGQWRALTATMRLTAGSVRGRPVLLTILVIALLGGVSSEALDRLWPLHLVGRFSFPPFFGLGAVGWFGLIQAGSLVGGIGAVWVAGRLTALDDPRSLGRSVFLLATLLIASALGFALAGGFGVALVALWVTGWVRAAQEPLFLAWVNRGLDSRSRATVLSVFSQADALGQVAGGPALGVLATVRSVRAALLAVGLVLVPSLPLYGWASRREPRAGADHPAEPAP